MVTIKNSKRISLKGHYQKLSIALSSINLIWKIMFMEGNGWVRDNQASLPADNNYKLWISYKTAIWKQWRVYRSRCVPLESPCPQENCMKSLMLQLVAWYQTWLAWCLGKWGCWWKSHSFSTGEPLERERQNTRDRTPQIQSFHNSG